MAKAKITTDRQVAALKPAELVYETPIADVRGLAVRTFPSGAKAFELRYVSKSGVRRRMPLGEYPGLSLAAASEKARALRVSVVAGEDPAGDRLADRTRARTGDSLRELAEAYWSAAAKGLHGGRGRPKAASTLSVEKTRFEKHIAPKLGERRFADLKRPDIKVFMRELAAGDMAADSVASVGRTLSALLSFAVHEERIDANPATGLTQPRALKPRDRMFPDASLKALWKPLSIVPTLEPAELKPRTANQAKEADASPAISLALKFTLLTLTRRADIAGGKWSEIDWRTLTFTVHATRHKSRKPHVVPLSRQAVEVLQQAAKLGGDANAKAQDLLDGYIFPSPSNADRHVTEHAMTRALSRMCEDLKIPTGSPHDFRRTGATHLTSERLGFRRFVVSKVLGHAAHEGATVTAVYDRNEYLADKRRALEAWDGLLLELVGEGKRTQNVVPMRGPE